MKRRGVLYLALLLCLWPMASAAESLQEAVDAALSSLNVDALHQLADGRDRLRGDVRTMLRGFTQGQAVVDAGGMLRSILNNLFSTLSQSLTGMLRIFAPALAVGVAAQLRSSFSRPFVAATCEYAGFLLVAGFLLKDLTAHVELTNRAVGDMAGAMQSIFPLLVTLLVAVGGAAGAAVYQPAVAWAGGTMTALIQNATLPVALGMAVLTMVGALGGKLRLGRLRRLLERVAHWTLGVSFTVFIGVTMVQGLGSAAVDGVSIRTAKYALDNFIPIVGGMFADTVDTLVGCSLLIKNAVGVLGLLLLLGRLLTPLVQAGGAVLLYRATAAVLEPIASERVVRVIDDFAGVLMLLFIIQLSVGAMFLLLMAQVLVVGNLTVMLR